MTDGGTWRDYFIGDAITAMTQYKALNDYAAENGIALSDEEKAEIDEQYASLGAAAEQNGFSSTEKFIAAYYGSGVTEKIAKEQAFRLGVSRGIDPFMTLSFMSLPVIPTLRLTTRGVIDVIKQQYI